jgi:tetratricopeptide (TPR) repeat protein
VIVLVAEAQPARLRELVLALLDLDAGLRVCVKAPALLDVPAGATVLLRLRAQDSTWLNYTRPIFSERAWRVVLWDEDGVTAAIKEQAPDFFDWISHVVACSPGVPGFAVRGLRTAPRFPGVVWRGQDFERALAAADPDAVSTALSARAPYAELVAAAREAMGWLVCRDMASERDLVRLRWALAETGRVARCVLVEPTVDAPGWWPVSDEFASWDEMLQAIGGNEPAAAAFVAALLEREPGTGELAGELLDAGVSLAELATELRELDDPGAALARLANRRGLIAPDDVIERRAAPAVLRALDHDAEFEHARTQRAAKVTAALAIWCADSGQLDDWSLDDVDVWAWAGMAPAEVLALTVERPPHWTSVYWLEATLGTEQPSPAAVAWAQELDFADVAAHWENVYGLGHAEPVAQRRQDEPASTVSERRAQIRTLTKAWARTQARNQARLMTAVLRNVLGEQDGGRRLVELAGLLGDRGQHQEAEKLLRQALAILETSLGAEHPDVAAVLDGLAKVLKAQGRYDEAESLWRRAIAIGDQAGAAVHPASGNELRIGDLQQSPNGSIRSLQRERDLAVQVGRDLRVLASSNELGDMEMAAGNFDAARAHYSAGLDLATKLAAMEPGDAEAQRDLLASELRLARLEIRAQQQAEARRPLDAARVALERLDAAGSLRGDALLEKYRQDIIAIERELSP